MPETEVQDTIYYLERLLSELRRYEWGYRTNCVTLEGEALRVARGCAQDISVMVNNSKEETDGQS